MKIDINSFVKIKPNRMDDYKIYHSLGIYGKTGRVVYIHSNKTATVEINKKEYIVPIVYLEPKDWEGHATLSNSSHILV